MPDTNLLNRFSDRDLKLNSPDQLEVEKLENYLGHELPLDFKSFFDICNGQANDGYRLFGNYRSLSANGMMRVGNHYSKIGTENLTFISRGQPELSALIDQRLRNDSLWQSGWLAFAEDGRDHLAIDLVPSSSGTTGQVFVLKGDELPGPIIGNSFADFLVKLCASIDEGKTSQMASGYWLDFTEFESS
jgi:cell wall assembly regulator SMI1